MLSSPLIRRIGTILYGVGCDPRKPLLSVFGFARFVRDYFCLWRQNRATPARAFHVRLVPILSDRKLESGMARGHYFHQDLWAARRIYQARPVKHVDVGSRVDGFIAHVLTFREVEVLDIRRLETRIVGLKFRQADILNHTSIEAEYTDSLSCLHALEHFGLGRYGDDINVDGWTVGLGNLTRMLKHDGVLYLSVPIGPECIEFNAQRIFRPETIVSEAKKYSLVLEGFSFVDDKGEFFEEKDVSDAAICWFGCGCFQFRKV